MKHWLIRALTLALAVCMVLSITACGKKEESGPTTQGVKPLEGETPEDLNGYEFTIVDFNSGRWNKENSGTPYSDAWIQIMDEVETLYNVKFSATYLQPAEIFNTVQPEIAAAGKYADLVVTTQWEFGKFLGAELMMDLNTLEVNWDNPWWNQRIREMCSYGGKTYVAGGSFIFDTAQTWLLYYNEAIWKECGFEDPYKLVDDHRWTQDLFAEYCRTAARDMDQSGSLDSLEDRWGVLAADGDFCRAWYMALGGKYFETNPTNGHVQLACNTQRTYDIVEKMRKMTHEDKTICTLKFENEAEKIAEFSAGKSLFYAYMPGVGGLQDMEDDWGVIPLPLFDENQKEYLSGVDHNSSVFGVTKTNKDTHQVSVILEALGRHAMILENIYWPDYKETYWRHEESDTRMVSQYVVGHGQHDLSLIMQNTNSIFSTPMGRVFGIVYGSQSADMASYIEAVEDTIEARLDEYFGY